MNGYTFFYFFLAYKWLIKVHPLLLPLVPVVPNSLVSILSLTHLSSSLTRTSLTRTISFIRVASKLVPVMIIASLIHGQRYVLWLL